MADGGGPTISVPFPWFGGKSRVAPIVWQAFGNVPNFVEPFFGSGAVLLGRPHEPHTETVNDKDGFICNFFRAIAADPDAVARHADNQVNENDLTARHIWLVGKRSELTALLEGDPEYYDAKIAGWWCWGICCWIGSGWCSGNGPWSSVDGKLVPMDDAGQGVNRQLVHLGSGRGVNRQLVHLGDAGQGVNRKLVHLGNAGQGVNGVQEWFRALGKRLRRVRVCCGDWKRVCGPSPTFKHGVTGVFLDPPYSADACRAEVYSCEDLSVAHDVRRWCIENGDNPLLRIALCGYDSEHNDLAAAGWRVHAWKADGGYGKQGIGRGRDNAPRERIWFSPFCISLNPAQRSLFDTSP
jgi:D12 class N6 adenine-specific DNA methyltransferase